MTDDTDRTLVLFFTLGVSLKTWAESGMLDREVALYDALGNEFDRIYLLTYGDGTDRNVADALPDHVAVVPKRVVSNDLLYSLLLPFLQRDVLGDADLLKTNQMLGSWAAVLSSWLHRVPLVVRTGYVLSVFYDRKGHPLVLRLLARAVEHVAYRAADAVVTSSAAGYDYVEERYHPARHAMIPNYVETDVFRPIDVEAEPSSVCFVGRLAPQKNLRALLRALDGSGYALTVVGTGPLEDELRGLADDLDVEATFAGTVPNHDLPELLNRHEVFVLPSHYEGMPKTLLEAMACGLAVVGTDIEGIEEVVEHERTGLLCETDAAALRAALDRLVGDGELRRELGEAAREEILDTYSLETVLEAERACYREVLAHAD